MWAGTQQVLLHTPMGKFYNLFKSKQTAFHNLCTIKQPPPGTDQLLWNGLKFCIEQPLPKPNLDQTFERLTEDIRRKYFWIKHDSACDREYNRKLYKKSGWTADEASPELEEGLATFKSRIVSAVTNNLSGQKRRHNIPTRPRKQLRTLPSDNDFIVIDTDKNLGPAILNRSVYKQRCLDDHLLDNKTYRQLSKEAAELRLQAATFNFTRLIRAYRKDLSTSDRVYFERCFEEDKRMPQFYCTPKVHKKPKWKTRPIVSCVNSRMGDLSKRVDVQLQKVVHLCPCYLKDSRSLLRKLKRLGKLPPTAALVTADAVSMYTNIDTQHGLQVLKQWFQLHEHELPEKFPTSMVLKATKLVMSNNVFQFDDTYWLQLTGTAMGTSLACIYATIYYSYHEETRILPAYAHQHVVPPGLLPPSPEQWPALTVPPLLLHARLIDDAIQIWDTAHLTPEIHSDFVAHMQQEFEFGSLEWEVESLSRSVNFLDLTINLETDGSITTQTFVKPMNLHLYIPPNSAHPPGVLKSLIYGSLHRYRFQNSRHKDFVSASESLHSHLLNRGYRRDKLTPIFLEAAASLDRKVSRDTAHGDDLWETPTATPDDRLFIHWEYHPRDIGRKDIRQIFDETLAQVLTESGLPTRQLTIAYSTPESLSQCLTKTQMEEPADDRVSSYI